jgi:restriction system protein
MEDSIMSKRYKKRYKKNYQSPICFIVFFIVFAKILDVIGRRFGKGYAVVFGGGLLLAISILLYSALGGMKIFMLVLSSTFILMGILMELIPYLIEKNKHMKMSKLNFSEVERLNPYDFEEWVASMFNANGYRAKTTKKSGDFGADVIAKYKDKKIAIQVKKYTGSVGVQAVEEVLGGMHYYKCDEAWVVTNSISYTSQAECMANKTNVNLLNRDKTIDFFYKLSDK